MSANPPVHLRFATFELDEGNARLWRAGKVLPLTPKAFDVLCTLVRNAGQLVPKDALLDAVWGHRHVSESVLKTTISELRAALGDDARHPRYVETAARRGYRFIGADADPSSGSESLPEKPLGGTRVAGAGPRMIGRQKALAKLRELWQKALGGERQIVWIVGEAGVGKTTLIREFLSEIDPMVWSHGQCVEQYGAGEPYLPFLEGLGVLCQRDPDLPAKLRAGAPTWLLQMPLHCSESDRAALRLELAGATQERMARELRECIDLYSVTHPLLFVTEDLHWSDGATLRMLDYLARQRGPARVMWLSSFRLTEVLATDHPLKAIRHELRLHGLATEIALDSFSEAEVAEYLAEHHPTTHASEPFVRTLHQHTDGLPLFLARVVDDLAAQGALESADTPSVTTLAVPENLAGVIQSQLARVPDDSRRLLEAASVCGSEFRARNLADVLGREVARVTEECERLAQRQQWIVAVGVDRLPDGALDARYGFRHALYQRVLYQNIGALTRAQWHHRVAASMEGLRAQGVLVSSAELAMHRELSQDPMAALGHYADATENALRRFAPAEALTLTAQALRLLPSCPENTQRLEQELILVAARGVAASQLLGVGSPEAMEAFERAQQLTALLPAAPTRAAEHTNLGWVLFTRGEFVQMRNLAARLLEQGERRGDLIQLMGAYNLLGTSMCVQGELIDGIARIEQAVDICRTQLERIEKGAPFILDPMVSQLTNQCVPLCQLARLETAQARMDAALARARALHHPMSEMLALWYSGVVAWHRDDPERMLALATEQQALVTQHRLVQGEGPAMWLRGLATARLGDPRTGLDLIESGLHHHASRGMHGNNSIVIGFAAEALLLLGRVDAALRRIGEALELATGQRERVYIANLLLYRGQIEQADGRLDDARESMRAAIREAAAQEALWPELSAHLALCELKGSGKPERKGLAEALARVREARDIPLVLRAAQLLATA